jgi:hypothetical protein
VFSNSELQLNLESKEEELTRQKQILREATAKHQNLIRHLKLIEAESGRIMYDETNVAQVHSKEDLQRLGGFEMFTGILVVLVCFSGMSRGFSRIYYDKLNSPSGMCKCICQKL